MAPLEHMRRVGHVCIELFLLYPTHNPNNGKTRKEKERRDKFDILHI